MQFTSLELHGKVKPRPQLTMVFEIRQTKNKVLQIQNINLISTLKHKQNIEEAYIAGTVMFTSGNIDMINQQLLAALCLRTRAASGSTRSPSLLT